ncbi:hypothetical protein [Chitinimonas naiadis]
MPAPAAPSFVVILAILPLIAWRIYSRVRRLVGRQKFSPIRPWLTIVLLPLLLSLLVLVSLRDPLNLAALTGGAAVGIGLGIFGLRTTRFDASEAGLYYTPNAHLGIALSLLLVGRVLYRLAHLYFTGELGSGRPGPQDLFSPLTLLIFGTLAAYYVSYAIGLLGWKRRVTQAAGQTPTLAPLAE